MQEHAQSPETFVSAFSTQRVRLLHHVGSLLGSVDPSEVDAERLPKLAALLATSLEALKVAEEELRRQEDEILTSRSESQRDLQRCRMLFDAAPSALLLTSRHASIRELNRATTTLLGRTAYQLEGRPLASLVPVEQRAPFREVLSGLSPTAGVTSWRFTVERHTDLPIEVDAAVHMISAQTGELYWHLSPRAIPA